ncbi:complement C1q domain-containing protein, partial [Aquitalea aquatica]
SINYLIEASYADVDSNPVLLPYYNSASPSSPYSGQGNNGLTQPTARKGTVVLTAKAGVPAATGSQTTPVPDFGNVGLYVVTVAYGQTQITAGNISQYAAAPFISLVNMGQVQTQAGTAFQAGGTAPAYTLAPSPAITAYASGQRFRVAFGAAGTTGSNTLNISGLGAVSLKQYGPDGTLVPAVIPGPMLSDVEYNGTVAIVLDPVVTGFSSLQSLTAVAASNALTVTLPPGAQAYRSATLANGATTSLSNAAALTLTIPTGATLGMGNGLQGQIAVLELYAGGTPQLAVCNAAGVVDLSETGLVSTTAIGAGSTSSSTIYSTTAVTNSPYRLVGYITLTEATAGTYASQPTNVISAGGIAGLAPAVMLKGLMSNFSATGNSQSISASTNTAIICNTKASDDLGEYSTSTGRFTATNTGTYIFAGNVHGTSVTNAQRILMLYVNGVERYRLQEIFSASGNAGIAGSSIPIQLNAGDYVQMYYFYGSTDTLNGATFSGWRIK